MDASLRIARLGGTPISVNAGLAVLAGLFVFSLAIQGFPQIDPEASLSVRLGIATATVVVFLLSILAHELGHATVAKRHGVGVLGITLSLLGGYAQLDRQAPTPKAEFRIAAAGPAMNIVIGGLLGAIGFGLYRADLADGLVLGAVAWLAGINVVLALINLFPAAPLDGGRVLTAGLWKRLGDAERARIISGRIGLVLGSCLAVAGLVQLATLRWEGLITIVVGLFLFTGARGEIGAAAIRRRLQRTPVAAVMVADPPSVADSLTVHQLATVTGPGLVGVALPVVRWTAEPIGYVIPDKGDVTTDPGSSWTTVGELMQPSPEVARAWSTEPVDTVLARLPTRDDVLVVVHDPESGRVLGTVSDAQVAPLLDPPDLIGRDRARPSDGAAAEQTAALDG